MRKDERVVEAESSAKVMFSPCTLNTEEQRGAVEMLRAVKLVSAATHSIADLIRAQKTDLVTVALRQCLDQDNLQSTTYKFMGPPRNRLQSPKCVCWSTTFTISGRVSFT